MRLLHLVLGVASGLTLAAPPAPAAESAPLVRPMLVAHRVSATVSTMTATRDGAVSMLATGVPTGTGTRSIVVSPDGRFAFSAGRESNDITSYTVGADGTLTVLEVYKGQDDLPFGIVISPDGRTLYVGNQRSDVVSAFAIDARGRLTARGPAIKSGALHTRVMSMTPDGRFLFVGHGDKVPLDPGVLTGFKVAPDGTLVPHVGPIATGVVSGSPAITPDGRFLYVPAEESNEVYGFLVAADGTVSALPGSPYATPGEHMGSIVTPDGRFFYQADITADVVRGYRIGTDGALAEVAGSPFAAGDLPVGMATSPDGRFLYVANFNSHDMTVYSVGDTGVLAQSGARVLTGGQSPATRSIAVLPNQEPRARFGSRPAGDRIRFDASASTDRDGRVVRYDWDFGDGTVALDAGPVPTHTYRRPGTYAVTLTVTDDEGCSTKFVYTGYMALCTGSPAATMTRRVTV